MANVTMSKFLGDWTKSITKPLRVVKKKLTPEFYLGSKANPESEIYSERNDDLSGVKYQSYEYIGDGELSIESYASEGLYAGSSDILTFDYFFGGIGFNSAYNSSGTATITSAETDNYKAGEWVFPFTIIEHSV